MKILETKINIPLVSTKLILRSRLMSKFEQIPSHKITMVTAPAGSGKTCSLINWIKECERKSIVAWVSLGVKDDDPARFWSYVIVSLGRLIKFDFEDWLSTALRSSQVDLDDLIHILAANLTSDTILILDDFHYIQSETTLESVSYFMEYLPQKLHLVISSRHQPALPIEQYRIKGQLLEVTLSDLQFTEAETEEYLRTTIGAELSRSDVSQLTLKTEGWIAGLQLAALSFQGKTPEQIKQFTKFFSGTHFHVDSFLAKQVFNTLPEKIKEFLLITSILYRLDPTLCDSVTGRTDSAEVIKWLEQNHLFLIRLDENEQWFRYHSLFRDFLQNRLTDFDPQRLTSFYKRAVSWCEENDLLEEAVQYALDVKDFKLAGDLVSHTAQSLWNRSDVNTMKSWLSRLPEEILLTRPYLFFSFAWVSGFTARFMEMGEYIRRAREYFNTPGLSLSEVYSDMDLSSTDEWMLSPQGVEVSLGLVNMFYDYFMGNAENTFQCGMDIIRKIPTNNSRLLGIAYSLLGRAQLATHDLSASQINLRIASEANKLSGYVSAYLDSSFQSAMSYYLRGKLNEAFAILDQASQYGQIQEKPVLCGVDLIGKGNIYREWNDFINAENCINEGLTLAKAGGDFMFLTEAYLAKIHLEYSMENYDDAFETIQRAEKLFINSPTCVENILVHSWALRVWSAQGEVEKARYWITNPKFQIESMPPYYREFFLITKTRVLICDGRSDEARSLLNNLLSAAESGGRTGKVIEILILTALVNGQEKSTTDALKYLLRAIELAQPEKYSRLFLDEGKGIRILLKKALQSCQQQKLNPHLEDYIGELLNSPLAPDTEKMDVQVPMSPNQPLIDPLSERELEILSMMANGIAYELIADKLVIAISTVRWHVKNIFRKLNVHSGLEAVAIARNLGVLS
ncbi:MAG: hypothetical protein JNM55_02080 [Anaerolineales bacterium]|nr:hypothetical protein [Anaerolineales bacterium]